MNASYTQQTKRSALKGQENQIMRYGFIDPLLETIITSPTDQLFKFLLKKLPDYYSESQIMAREGFYIYAPGENPICLVAHMDSWADYDRGIELIVKGNTVKNRNGILGADDRAGVYAILRILESCKKSGIPLPPVILTDGEENGCIGAQRFTEEIDFEGKAGLLIELDRKGANEYVHYNGYLPATIRAFVEAFGYEEKIGISSDIMCLTEAFGIPSVNLSIGFHDAHSREESLNLDHLEVTIKRVLEMLRTPVETLPENL